MSKPSLREIEDRFRASLLCLAIGDALGNPVEGLSPDAIQKSFGCVVNYEERWEAPGTYTDDTELTLCTAESIIGVQAFSLDDIARRFCEWLPNARSFGMATQAAIVNLSEGISPLESGVDSAGNGAAMRVAPLGLLYSHPNDARLLLETTRQSTFMTHANPKALAGALAVANSLKYILNLEEDIDPEHFIAEIYSRTKPVDEEFAEAVRKVSKYAKGGVGAAVKEIRTSGYVVHSVPFALYCFLHSPKDFEQSITNAVNAGGDADTNASIAGALSGCYNGLSAIPERWLEGLKGKSHIDEAAKALFQLYLFNLPSSEDRRVLIYRNQANLESALDAGDLSKAAHIYGELASSHAFLGDYERALRYVERGISLQDLPIEREVSLRLVKGKIYAMAGDKKAALDSLESIRSSNPHHKITKELLAKEILSEK
jgi:ADP-ribosylglycohydrolase